MWSDGRIEQRIFWHLSFIESPIALTPGVEYKIMSTRVAANPIGFIEVRHLVIEVKQYGVHL